MSRAARQSGVGESVAHAWYAYSNGDEAVRRPSEGETRTQALRSLEAILVPYVVGHAPFAFPKHRWTGMQKSLCDLGILSCAHDFLGIVYEECIVVHHAGTEPLRRPAREDPPPEDLAPAGGRAAAVEDDGKT